MLMTKSIAGDVRAAEVLLKYAIDKDEPVEPTGFFSQNKLVLEIVDTQGRPYPSEPPTINEEGQITVS